MAFNMMWKPGPEAVAGMQTVARIEDQVALVVYLDPDSLAIMPPADKSKWPEFTRLMREIRDGADELADFLEAGPSDAASGPEPLIVRHGLSESGG